MSSLDQKNYWRSLSDLEASAETSAEIEAYLEQRIPEHRELFGDPPTRRRFMQIMGASVAFAGAAGMAGCRWESDHIAPLEQRPDGYVPGVPKYYASAMEIAGAAHGLLVTAFDGRPTKVDGNPDHPNTGKGSTAFVQASLLDMWDPDRSRKVERNDNGKPLPASWSDFERAAADIAKALSQSGGRGFRVLSEATTSPTIAALKARLLATYPQAQWHEWEPISYDDNEREGMRMAFGQPMRSHLQLGRARVIAALDADLFCDHPDSLRLVRDYVAGRNPDGPEGAMNRLYSVESNFSQTGASADHRLPLRSELIKPFLMALEQKLQGTGGAVPSKALEDAKVGKFLEVMAKDLAQNRGAAVIAVGYRQPPEVHALAARINAQLGADALVTYTADADSNRPPRGTDIAQLASAMKAGGVDTLLILGGNPLYDAPVSVDFAAGLAKVKTTIHLSVYSNETSVACNWHLPRAHYLEAWGDARTWDGTYTLAQPIIEPMHGGRSAIDVLKLFVGLGDTSARDLVEQTVTSTTGGLASFRKAIHDGFVSGTAYPAVRGTPAQFTLTPLTPTQKAGLRLKNGQVEVSFVPSPHTFDGRFANNAWLQEMPDFMAKLTWDNAMFIGPKTAAELGIAHSELVSIDIGGRAMEVAAYVMPGQAPFTIALPLGQGRTHAGHVGGLVDGGVDPIGFDTYKLRGAPALLVPAAAKLTGTGKSYQLASTVDHWKLDEGGAKAYQKRIPELVKENTLEGYKHDPNFVVTTAHTPDQAELTHPSTAHNANQSLFEEHRYLDHKWGMTTDLGKCIGCNACVVACQAENNVPVVGKEQVSKNREMHWLRIDRYFEGDPNDPSIASQPILCQHCENAPCEQVCPVAATIHSEEGLNEMVYNRCVGTRYCLNNCPYRVRRFNFLRWDWMKELDDPRNKVRELLFNPEVTVRSRGVMEKCTFCVQRIQQVKIQAKNPPARPIQDGEIQTACQQACPTGAIVFGDLNDPDAEVTKEHLKKRSYALLAELNTRPRNVFLARIRNLHEDLEPQASVNGHE